MMRFILPILAISAMLAALAAFAASFDGAAIALFCFGLVVFHRALRSHFPPDQFDNTDTP